MNSAATASVIPVEFDKKIIHAIEQILKESMLNNAWGICQRNGLNFSEEMEKQGVRFDANGNPIGDFICVRTPKKVVDKITRKKENKKGMKLEDYLPFIRECVCHDKCQAITFAKGLFNQCKSKKPENGLYCKKCTDLQLKCGTIEDRLRVPGADYVDPAGRKVTNYLAFLEKNGISIDEILDLARQMNVTIDESYLQRVEKKVSQRGRPKKNAEVVAKAVTEQQQAVVDNVFNQLIQNDSKVSEEVNEVNVLDDDNEFEDAVQPPVAEEKPAGKKRPRLTQEEKD